MKTYYVYMLECSDKSYYTGITSNLTARLEKHQSGRHKDSYTHSRRPVKLMFYGTFTEVEMAIATEKQIKKWSRAKKKALIEGAYDELVNLAKKSLIKNRFSIQFFPSLRSAKNHSNCQFEFTRGELVSYSYLSGRVNFAMTNAVQAL